MPEQVFEENKTAGLIWIGDKFYSPEKFMEEAAEMGVSRRIKSIPRNFKIGETWVFFAHKKAVTETPSKPDQKQEIFDKEETVPAEKIPGIFCAFKPTRIERIVKESDYQAWLSVCESLQAEYDNKEYQDKIIEAAPEAYHMLERDRKRGIIFVTVPDNDPDHQ